MIGSSIGKVFLDYLNEKEKSNLTPEEFFLKRMYPSFFKNKKFSMEIKNSPFNNPSLSKKKQTEEGRNELLNGFLNKIKEGKRDGSVFIGGGSEKLSTPTSYNASLDHNIIREIDEDDVYLSWIAQGLSIKFNNGIYLLFNNPELLYDIFLGWEKYSKLLNSDEYASIKEGQINVWNGHYIIDLYNSNLDEASIFDKYDKKENKLEIASWVDFGFALTKKFEDEQLAYAYGLDYKNEKTLGFINFKLKSFDTYLNFFQYYFGKSEYLRLAPDYKKVLGTALSFERLCEKCDFNYESLMPKLFQLQNNSYDKIEIKNYYDKYSKSEDESKIYKNYILTILNNKNMEKEISDYVTFLLSLKNDKTTKSDGARINEEILASKNVTQFINNLTKLTKFLDEKEKLISINLKNDVIKYKKEFNYFIALLNYEYYISL